MKVQKAPGALKKIIDIPGHIVKDLKMLSIVADKSFKTFIEDILVEKVASHRKENDKTNGAMQETKLSKKKNGRAVSGKRTS